MDLRRIDWKAGAYDLGELSNLFTGNDARARIILKAVRDKVADLAAMKALGFCVSQTTPATWPRCSMTPVSVRPRSLAPPARSSARRQSRPALRPSAGALHRRCLQRGRRRASHQHRALPATDRELDHLPSAARPGSSARRTRQCSPPSTSLVTTASSASTAGTAHRRAARGAAGAGHRAWLPLPASRHADRAGPPESGTGAGEHPQPGHQCVEADHR